MSGDTVTHDTTLDLILKSQIMNCLTDNALEQWADRLKYHAARFIRGQESWVDILTI